MEDTDTRWKLGTVLVTAAMILVTAPVALGGGADVGDPAPPAPGIIEDRIVVAFEDGMTMDVREIPRELGGTVAMVDTSTNWVALEFDSAEAADRALEEANAREDVRYAEHDGYVSLLQVPEVPPNTGEPVTLPGNQLTSPNDPDYGEQWGYPAIHAPEAWQITNGTHDVKVAVLDTGLDTDHPDIAANACGPFESFVPDEPTVEDGHGHGTHTSGTVAAASNDGTGVAGTSQSCLMHGKVLTAGGWGYWSWIAGGITWAADNGADIISMSLSGPSSSVVESAVDYAYNEQDVLVVSAAGNSGGWGCPSVGYPAAFDASMAVAAVEEPGHVVAGFSSCGEQVDIAAPGVDVLSTYKNGGYRSWAGTSMAAPHVAGVAALVKADQQDISAEELRCRLYATADDIADPGRDQDSGFGRVNALRALTSMPLSIDNPSTPATNAQALQAACGASALTPGPVPALPGTPAP